MLPDLLSEGSVLGGASQEGGESHDDDVSATLRERSRLIAEVAEVCDFVLLPAFLPSQLFRVDWSLIPIYPTGAEDAPRRVLRSAVKRVLDAVFGVAEGRRRSALSCSSQHH